MSLGSEMRKHTKPITLWILDGLACLLVAAALVVILFFTPTDIEMGAVQKVFYFHIASGWAGMLSFLVATVSAIIFLAKKQPRWDALSVSSIEVGLVFSIITTISGMIWAKPIWGTWWTWDPRLTTMAIMVLLYAAYFILRSGIENMEKRRDIASVYAIVGFISVPLTFFSIRAYRSIHPLVITSQDGSFLSEKMIPAFIISLVAFSFLFLALLWERTLLESKKAMERGEEK
jgi:heme exporter protein C